jgi:hypothetical protein
MTEVLLAARLLAIAGAVLVLPGLLLLRALGVAIEWPERLALAFSLSYSWVFILSVVVPLFGWTSDHAAVLTVILAIALAATAIRGPKALQSAPVSLRERLAGVAVAILLAGCAIAGWIIEAPFTGEEGFELASVSRFADGGVITFDNTSFIADARAVYLFQPYQLALGLIARWSGIAPLVALIKFRAFLAPLALVLVYSLLRRLSPSRAEAGAAFAVVLLFVGLDMTTWEWNSLFPFVRRGGVSAGICVPAVLGLCLAATRRAQDRNGLLRRRIALIASPLMLTASLSTHPLEMFPVLCFTAGLAVAIFAGLDPAGSRRHAASLLLLLAASAGGYIAIHSRAVPYVADHERQDKASLRIDLGELAADPVQAVVGPSEGRSLLLRTFPSTTAVVFGIPSLALVALRTPATAVMLAFGMVPLALVYAMPAGLIVLKLLTSVETVMDVNAYFGLLGLIAIALGTTALTQVVLAGAGWRRAGFRAVLLTAAAGSIFLWVSVLGVQTGVQWLGSHADRQPESLLLIGGAVTIAIVIVAALRPRAVVPPSPFPMSGAVLAACLALPLAAPNRPFGGVFAERMSMTIIDRFRSAGAYPSVLDWPRYYDDLPRTYAAVLTVPRAVVDELRQRLPPRQVLLAHPRYSCDLVVLLDAYCFNPAAIHGHFFEPASGYLRDYVRDKDGPAPQHPFFDETSSLTDAERRLLRQYHVSYVLADPEHADRIAAKLDAAGTGAMLVFERDGYRLFRLSPFEARTPDR